MTAIAVVIDGPFYVGDQATLLVQWSDPLQTATPTDPNTGYTLVIPTLVTCTLKDPTGKETALTVVPPGQGAYQYKAVTPTFAIPGSYWFGWDAAGTYVAHKEGVIPVRQRRS